MAAHGASSSPSDASTPESRVRFVVANAERRPGSRVRVSVEVRFDDRTHVAEAEGIGTETIEIRLAALATLEAIRQVAGTRPFRFVGVKRMHAFDADVIIVALSDPESESTRFIGAVPVRTTYVAAAAAAVMDATNRVLFRRANTAGLVERSAAGEGSGSALPTHPSSLVVGKPEPLTDTDGKRAS